MSTETREDGEVADEPVDGSLAPAASGPDDRNDVAVHFTDGSVEHYAFVVRSHDADWCYAEALSGDPEGFDEERIEALNAAEIRRIAADRVHLFDDGVVHYGSDLVVDPATLLEDSWFDADVAIL